MFGAFVGYGLGGSTVALFGRDGGGIYTEAADVGADLPGKNEYGLEEDDMRNPACIANNVGDNVGDIAGMGADLFGSFAEVACAAMVLVASSDALQNSWKALMYPVLISSLGIAVGISTLVLSTLVYRVHDEYGAVEKALEDILTIGIVLMSPVLVVLSWMYLADQFGMNARITGVRWWCCALAISLCLWSGLLIGFVTEYYTSSSYVPVREIAETQKQSSATGVIYGLALGYVSTIIPVVSLGITNLVAHSLCGGVALGALGMLGTLTIGLTIDAFGSISDNAGGIGEMSELDEWVRERTDVLGAAGNTTAAIWKRFAIGSAAFVSLALFGSFYVGADVAGVDARHLWVFTGLLFGAMMLHAFAALTVTSVGKAANEMVQECMQQLPKIIDGSAEPVYKKCILTSMRASLNEMLAPGALVILSLFIAGFLFGKLTCAGLLSGALVSSVQLAISLSNTGGAWDNAKNFMSAGELGPDHAKGSDTHKNSVTGDTVEDPLKDISGPALNIVMKLTAW